MDTVNILLTVDVNFLKEQVQQVETKLKQDMWMLLASSACEM